MNDLTSNGDSAIAFPNQFSEKSFQRTGWRRLMNVPWRRARIDARVTSPPDDVVPVLEFPSSIDAAWISLAGAIGTRRDAGYLNWRFAKPGTEYHRYILGDESGVMVTKVFEEGRQRTVNICELMTAQGAELLARSALDYTRWFATGQRAGGLTAWGQTDHHLAAVFDDAGFVLEPSPRTVFCTGPGELLPALLDSSSWFLSQSDNDVF